MRDFEKSVEWCNNCEEYHWHSIEQYVIRCLNCRKSQHLMDYEAMSEKVKKINFSLLDY